MVNTGEKPGAGTYVCLKCGETITLNSHTETLPPCPKCNATIYRKA